MFNGLGVAHDNNKINKNNILYLYIILVYMARPSYGQDTVV